MPDPYEAAAGVQGRKPLMYRRRRAALQAVTGNICRGLGRRFRDRLGLDLVEHARDMQTRPVETECVQCAADFLQPPGVCRELHQGRILSHLPSIGIAVDDGGIVIDLGINGKRKLRERFHSAYMVLENKYYVDELYAAVIVRPVIDFSRAVLWRFVDAGLIDGTIQSSAHAVRDVGGGVRQMQSGNIRSYAGWVALGAACVVAYMVWLGVR